MTRRFALAALGAVVTMLACSGGDGGDGDPPPGRPSGSPADGDRKSVV